MAKQEVTVLSLHFEQGWLFKCLSAYLQINSTLPHLQIIALNYVVAATRKIPPIEAGYLHVGLKMPPLK